MLENLLLGAAAGAAGTLTLMMFALRASALRRPLLQAAFAFSSTSAFISAGVMAGLSALAVSCVVTSFPIEPVNAGTQFEAESRADAIELLAAAPGAPGSSSPDEANKKALESLRGFANRMEGKREIIAGFEQDNAELPGVETMMIKLRARLEREPADVKGWMTLGWACANTGQLEEAVKAYETALKLDGSNAEIKSALDGLKAQAAAALGKKS